ncbi:MAG: hypothetical protein JST92_17940, partial [Deltaproteobacteria bacterium]|nr:hypothetical protein [Deltaproteobacteria bacterium]
MRPILALLVLLCACGGSTQTPPDGGGQDAGTDAGSATAQVSRSLALSADGKSLWAVNAESDSVSQIDVGTRSLSHEILLGAARPAKDPVS